MERVKSTKKRLSGWKKSKRRAMQRYLRSKKEEASTSERQPEAVVTDEASSSNWNDHDYVVNPTSYSEDSNVLVEEFVNGQHEEVEKDIAEHNVEVSNEEIIQEIELCTEKERNNIDEVKLEGRRIVDIEYLFKEIKNIGKHPLFDCSFEHMYPIAEKRIGLNSRITFKCKMCQIVKSINLCDITETSEYMDPNKGVVLGTLASGSGYSGTKTLFVNLNIPFMAADTYLKHTDTVADAIQNVTWKSIEDAGKEETEIAKNLGEVDKNGIPFITVIADGAWCKRSYSVNYNANSGVACIIGARTRKILFLGVRNKYCCVCSRAESKGVDKPVHTCYKNWTSTSTSMESDIILEGFKKSLELHGLIFKRLVADGDSSMYKKLQESRPYGNILIEKIECKNHLLRNFTKKIREICGRKRSNSKNVPVVPALRKLVEKSVLRMRTAIKCSVSYRIQEDTNFEEKVTDIQKDLRNIPSHVFGEHKLCSELNYFKCNKGGQETNHIPAMEECGLLQDIGACFNRLIYNAKSLIINMDTNVAEQYNSVVCKFVGGKRLNFSQRRGYITRCEAAAASFNTKGDYLLTLYDEMLHKEPPQLLRKFVSKMKKRSLKTMKTKKTIALPDEDYGLQAQTEPDMMEDE